MLIVVSALSGRSLQALSSASAQLNMSRGIFMSYPFLLLWVLPIEDLKQFNHLYVFIKPVIYNRYREIAAIEPGRAE